jgi:DNA-binding SARP family transcriptional activator
MMRVRIFGQTAVEIDGASYATQDMGGVKPRQILEILACELGSPVAKDRLADLLWSGEPPASYVGTLESYVCVLRRQLGLAGARRAALATTSSGYLLDPSMVSVDLQDYLATSMRASRATGVEALDLAVEAVTLLDGQLLASEPYADWAVRARQSFQQENAGLCVRAAQLATASGDHMSAVAFARRAVTVDPLSEDAGQQLMRALWFAGRRSHALRVYADLRQSLLEELGDDPGAETHELYLAILREGETAAPADPRESRAEVRTLLRLLRQAIDDLPGVRAPANDARLSEVAVRALA